RTRSPPEAQTRPTRRAPAATTEPTAAAAMESAAATAESTATVRRRQRDRRQRQHPGDQRGNRDSRHDPHVLMTSPPHRHIRQNQRPAPPTAPKSRDARLPRSGPNRKDRPHTARPRYRAASRLRRHEPARGAWGGPFEPP